MPSSVIRHFHYHAAAQELEVEFVNGRRYRYLQVPGTAYDGMRAAFAKGVYFNRHIRDRYRHIVVTDAEPSGDAAVAISRRAHTRKECTMANDPNNQNDRNPGQQDQQKPGQQSGQQQKQGGQQDQQKPGQQGGQKGSQDDQDNQNNRGN